MSTITIIWTALPNGISVGTGKPLQLSVFVSPRLQTTGGGMGTLHDFPDMRDWATRVKDLQFQVRFGNAAPVAAKRVGPPVEPALWSLLFNDGTPVKPYAFRDYSQKRIRSYPVKQVLGFLKSQYQQVAVKNPADYPAIVDLGRGGFGSIRFNRDLENRHRPAIDKILTEKRAVRAADASTPELQFLQARIFYERPGQQPSPALKPPKPDFHQMIGGLGQFPSLLRPLGIVFDLEVSVTAASLAQSGPALVDISPVWANPPITSRPVRTAYVIDWAQNKFLPATLSGASYVRDGMLSLPATGYELVEVDVDGAAFKAMDFAGNLSSMTLRRTQDTPDKAALPSLRSAGFALARTDRAPALVAAIDSSKAQQTGFTAASGPAVPPLSAEDVVRGFRIDVRDDSGNWHTLCGRDGTYVFTGAQPQLTRTYTDEGFVSSAATSDQSNPTDLFLHEAMFGWTGWSLAAPRPGGMIDPDCEPKPAGDVADSGLKLQATFKVAASPRMKLPPLRFGRQYQLRARTVDMAGNSLSFGSAIPDTYAFPPAARVPYLRFEPIAPPAVIPRKDFTANPAEAISGSPGESAERLVIRSNYNKHFDDAEFGGASDRHIVPPKVAATTAEQHGMFDLKDPADPAHFIGMDKTKAGLIMNQDGSFAKIEPGPALTLPYLPDPLVRGVCLRELPQLAGAQHIPFMGDWPNLFPFRLVLAEGSDSPVTAFENGHPSTLTVQLPKAEIATIRVSSFTDADGLAKMGIWKWIQEAAPPNLALLQSMALTGIHWMITPYRELTLVHAVKQPLIEPQFQKLESWRLPGAAWTLLTDKIPISGKSTIKLDILAEWEEYNDTDVTPASGHACEVPLAREDTVAILQHRHEFPDTKYRRVKYQAVANTRFREYFPPKPKDDPGEFTRISEQVEIDVLNATRPAAPKVLYVVPTFGWEQQREGDWLFSRRSGGGLRVYLDRPWYSSGEGELLGVVLWSCPPQAMAPKPDIPTPLKPHVTQWGNDPLWASLPLVPQTMPHLDQFKNAVATETSLPLDEVPNYMVAVAGHSAEFNKERGLWFSDIEIDMGLAYYPFVRLALARFQPKSDPGCHLSRVVVTDFVQLAPDRSASITFDPLDPRVLQVAVSGTTYLNPPGSLPKKYEPQVEVVVQEHLAGFPDLGSDDLAWRVAGQAVQLAPHYGLGSAVLWSGTITLPGPRDQHKYRLVIAENEIHYADKPGRQADPKDPATYYLAPRPVYVDVIEL